ncbi:MAG: anti-sigma factor, partial [Pseudomonadota bacterium]
PVASVPSFVADAAGAHQVFAPDNFHPVEFTAKDEAAMARWFSARLGQTATIPHLEELGFSLVGGRLLAGANGPAAQVMYENAKGDRVSLVFGKQQVPGGSPELKLVHVGKSYASYWQDKGFAWAVVEDTPGADVSMVATHVARITRE